MTQQIKDKAQLLEKIRTSRRRLDRLVFVHQRGQGGELEAKAEFKFSEEEARAPGVAGSWSLLQVLMSVRASEQAFMDICTPPILGPGGFSPLGLNMNPAYMSQAFGGPVTESLGVFLQEYQATHQKLLAMVQRFEEEQIFAPCPYTTGQGKILLEMIAEATFQRYDRAAQEIRQWLK